MVSVRMSRRLLVVVLLAGCGAPPKVEPSESRIAGCENVYRVSAKMISGSEPHGGEAFRALAAAGVRTIISVDGAKPEADLAEKFGIRYVHLPIGYDGVPETRAFELARALRDLDPLIYIH